MATELVEAPQQQEQDEVTHYFDGCLECAPWLPNRSLCGLVDPGTGADGACDWSDGEEATCVVCVDLAPVTPCPGCGELLD